MYKTREMRSHIVYIEFAFEIPALDTLGIQSFLKSLLKSSVEIKDDSFFHYAVQGRRYLFRKNGKRIFFGQHKQMYRKRSAVIKNWDLKHARTFKWIRRERLD